MLSPICLCRFLYPFAIPKTDITPVDGLNPYKFPYSRHLARRSDINILAFPQASIVRRYNAQSINKHALIARK